MPNQEAPSPVGLSVPFSLSVDRFSGSADVRVSFPLPEGRNGLTPQLGLRFGAVRNRGIFGKGWSLNSLPVIGAEGDGGLPSYDSASGYSTSLGGRLVAVHNTVGNPQFRDVAAFRVHQFRAETDDARIRFEKWVHQATGRTHWTSRDTTNTLTIYGRDASGLGRIVQPDDPSCVFQWLPELQISATGDAIRYQYLPEDLRGGAGQRQSEEGRTGTQAQRYLKQISWANQTPADPDDPDGFDTAASRWAYHAVFDYGDHAANPPQIAPDRDWPARRDAFSVATPGFELRTWRLCQRLLVFHHFAALGANPLPVTAYEFDYDPDPAGAILKTITRTGFRHESGATQSKSVPPLRFGYVAPSIGSSFKPAPQTLSNAIPAGLTTNRSFMVDLYGEGLPGILYDDRDGWVFQANLGGGDFAAPRLVNARPAHSLNAVSLGDFDGDGNMDAAVFSGHGAGHYQFDRVEEKWSAFRPFDQIPHIGAQGQVERLDLTGDGQSDLVLRNRDSLVYYKGRGKAGFDPRARSVRHSDDVATGPAGRPPIASNPQVDYLFADMTGDGLADQVLIRPGLVAYWPNLGHGRFGRPVLMENAPDLGGQSKFAINRIMLADLDGSGTADLIHIGEGEIRIWANASGNEFIAGNAVTGLPMIDTSGALDILDILGNGQLSLVWSTNATGGAPVLQMLPLSGATPPGLLTSIDNAMGREDRLEYGHSLLHYRRDANTENAWVTRLPSHSIVVDRLVSIDNVSGTQRATEFFYRNGVFDSRQRRFAGFGEVDVIDSSHIHDDQDMFATNAASLTRSFFDQGGTVDLTDRYWNADPRAVIVAPFEFDMGAASGIDGESYADARARVVGKIIRTEIYSSGATGVEAVPLVVNSAGYKVTMLQAPTGQTGRTGKRAAKDRAVFTVSEAENVSALYEGQSGDPRIVHGFVLEHDAVGAATLVAEIGYPRRAGQQPFADQQQATLHCSVRRMKASHIDTADTLALNQPVEEEEFIVPGLVPHTRGWFSRTEIGASLAIALASPLTHDNMPVPGRAIRTSWTRHYYWNTNASAVLPLGQTAQPLRFHHGETAVSSGEFMRAVYGPGIDARQGSLGYKSSDAHWWQSSEPLLYTGATGFFLGTGAQLRDGRITEISFDASALFPVRMVDANGAISRTEIDYQALRTAQSEGPTGGWEQNQFDPLGIAVRSAKGGHVSDGAGGQSLYGFDPLNQTGGPDLADLLSDPVAALDGAASAVAYDLDAWERDGTPVALGRLASADFSHDGLGNSQTSGHHVTSIGYFDGSGREILSKQKVEPGPAISRTPGGDVDLNGDGTPVLLDAATRWATSGWVALNEKGEAVRIFQGYFSPVSSYEDDAVLRGTDGGSRNFYDASGRLVQRLLPDGATETNAFDAWSQRSFDGNDTIATSAWRLPREILPADHPDRHALDGALVHNDTPLEIAFDALGRTVLASDDDRLGTTRRIRTVYAISQAPTAIIDERGITTTRRIHDMAGRVVRETSADAGTTTILFDNADNAVDSLSPDGVRHVTGFDALGRVAFVDLDDGIATRRILANEFSDDPADAGAVNANLYGQLVETRDEAGRFGLISATPDGTALHTQTRLVANPDTPVDWAAGAALDPEIFVTEMRLNALDRVVEERRADGSVLVPRYNERGALSALSVSTDDGRVPPTDVISGVLHSISGQRETATLGNGITLRRQYDPLSARVTRITARRSSAGGRQPLLQDMHYFYDPVGNITTTRDLAHDPAGGAASAFFTGNAAVSAERRYEYDAFYRLTACAGRAHPALTGGHNRPTMLPLADGSALERFTQSYTYDVSGNLTRLRHSGVLSNWTKDFWVDAASNRSRPVNGADGNPVVTPLAGFGAGGERAEMDHIGQMVWRHDQKLARVIIIDRSADGRPDDDEVYLYDAGGTRMKKITRRLLGDGSTERREVTYLGGCEFHRLFRGNTRILDRRTTRLSDDLGEIAELHRWDQDDSARETDDIAATRFSYTITDHLGSATLRLDAAARIVSYEEFMPFGACAFSSGDNAREVSLKTHGFIAKERDATTGLHYIGQRYYASWLCRWISPDPAGDRDGPNLFVYARNNPIVNLDPTGLQTTTVGARGREVPVNMPTPARVDAAFAALPDAEKVRLRGLMAGGNFRWFKTKGGDVHFGTNAEIEAIGEQVMAGGDDVGVVQNSDAETTDNPDEAQFGGTSTDETQAEDDPPGQDTTLPPGGTDKGQLDGSVERDDDETREGDDPDAQGDGDGTEPPAEDENGPGKTAGSDKTGTGGGGDSSDPNAHGRGDTGTGAGGGTGDPSKSGTGDKDKTGTGRGTGTIPGGAPGGVAGGKPGGTGQTAGANGTGQTPGGSKGSKGTGDTPGGGPGGEAGGIPGGSKNGGDSGDPAPEGTNPHSGSGGTRIAPSDAPQPQRSGAGPNGSAEGSGNGNSQPQQDGDKTNGAGGQKPATTMDQIMRVAGWWHLEFSDDPKGESGGIPGGMGSWNLGAWGQAAFLALTVVDLVLTVVSLGGLAGIKAGLKIALKAVTSFGRKALTRIGTVFTRAFWQRAGAGALRAGISWNPFTSRRLREFWDAASISRIMTTGGYTVPQWLRKPKWVQTSVEYLGFKTHTGSRVWASTAEVSVEHVDDLLRHLDGNGGKGVINVLTGRHGDTTGLDLFQRANKFFVEDLLRLRSSARIDIHDVTRLTDAQLTKILEHSDEVVLAWCHSEHSRRILRALGLNFKSGAPF